jgi:hypothetical protein
MSLKFLKGVGWALSLIWFNGSCGDSQRTARILDVEGSPSLGHLDVVRLEGSILKYQKSLEKNWKAGKCGCLPGPKGGEDVPWPPRPDYEVQTLPQAQQPIQIPSSKPAGL